MIDIIDVEFSEPMHLLDENGKEEGPLISGFLQDFGVSEIAKDKALLRVFEKVHEDEWIAGDFKGFKEAAEVSIIDHDDVDVEIYQDDEINDVLIGDPYEPGIWYYSGRGFYWPDEYDGDGPWIVELEKLK